MTGLGPGPASPILRGHLQNFVFMITLLLLLLLLLSLLFARRLINTMSGTRRFPIVIRLFVASLFACLIDWLLLSIFACLPACVLACLFACLFVCSFVPLFVCSFISLFRPKNAKGENEPLNGKKLSWGRQPKMPKKNPKGTCPRK